ncbi:MAG: DUF3772 domain-containing protein [Pseudomonadota bacterium]
MALSVFRFLLISFAALLVMTSLVTAQEDRMAQIEATTEEISALRSAIADPDTDVIAAEARLRELRQEARQRLSGVDQELNTVRDQLSALGPSPGEGDPPETAELAEQRAALNEDLARANSQRVRINANIAESNQLLADIANERVQSLYERLFSRGASLLSPALWSSAFSAAGDVGDKTGRYFAEWAQEKRTREQLGSAIAAITLAFGVSLFLFWPVNRWVMATFADAISRRKPTTDHARDRAGDHFQPCGEHAPAGGGFAS